MAGPKSVFEMVNVSKAEVAEAPGKFVTGDPDH